MPDQLALFADAPALPDGLRYATDFIPEAVEHDLIAHVAALPLQPFQFGQYEGRRRTASFGWRYDYSQRRLTEANVNNDVAVVQEVDGLIADIEAAWQQIDPERGR